MHFGLRLPVVAVWAAAILAMVGLCAEPAAIT